MKIKKDTILGKKLVQGDPNLVERNEILVKESGNKVQLYQRNSHGKLVQVNNQKPANESDKDYIKADIVKVQPDNKSGKNFLEGCEIEINIVVKENKEDTRNFLVFFPYYSNLDVNNTNQYISITIDDGTSHPDIHHWKYEKQITLTTREFLSSIIQGDNGEPSEYGFNPIMHPDRSGPGVSRKILGLIQVSYNIDFKNQTGYCDVKLMPAFNKKETITIQNKPSDPIEVTTYVQKFKITNIDQKVRTFYTLPLIKNKDTGEFYKNNRGYVRLLNPKEAIFHRKKSRCNFYIDYNPENTQQAYKEYITNLFTGENRVNSRLTRGQEYLLQYNNDNYIGTFIYSSDYV